MAMDSVYKPQDVEEKWYKKWIERKSFSASIDYSKSREKRFSIVMPPPNVTGSLHMGHALNNTIQDILIRWKRMKGYSVCWFPGTDHAGIATQVVVEKELKKEGKTRYELGREKFIERVWEWKKQYGGIIEDQLKKLGVSCDWDRNAFTMDEKRSAAVQEAFLRLYNKGLIYRGKRMVNWCVRCLTALSDLEVEHLESEVGTLYYLKYPLTEPVPFGQEEFDPFDNPNMNYPSFNDPMYKQLFNERGEMTAVMIATTRPETILADVAIAVHPQDSRYKHLIGKEAILPLAGRRLKIIADEWADPEVGTGAVKITPAHDPNDFEVGERHGLEQIVVIGLNGKMATEYDKYHGMDRFTCREEILKDLKEKGYLVKEESWGTSPGRCSRCGTIIEPYLSVQWFMKMKELAKPAVEAVKQGKVKFHPDRFSKLYLDWMENIKDWCISRQLWWGHRIPVWYCMKCNSDLPLEQMPGKGEIFSGVGGGYSAQDALEKIDFHHWVYSAAAKPIIPKIKHENGKFEVEIPKECPDCKGAALIQDDDVLDTWFSSALWPLSTMGWPEDTEDLGYFYPTQVLSTGRDIINLWVARMIMMGLEFKQAPPFSDVYIHATILDREGKRMSKSKGTGVDPLDLIRKYGADATRFGIVLMAQGQDVRFNEEKIQQARNFANKVWNAARFVRSNLDDDFLSHSSGAFKLEEQKIKFYDIWIFSRLFETIKRVESLLEHFDFPTAALRIYDFFWDDFCDWYLELSKIAFQGNDPERKKTVQGVLYYVLTFALKLLHPFMPFLTEEIWQNFNSDRLLIHEKWPDPISEEKVGSELLSKIHEDRFQLSLPQMQQFVEIVKGVRNLRAEAGIPVKQEAPVVILTSQKKNLEMMNEELMVFTQASELKIVSEKEAPPKKAFSSPYADGVVYLPLEGVLDLNAELSRLQEYYNQTNQELNQIRSRLMNPEFSEKAKKEVVQTAREKEKLLSEKIARTRERIASLTQ